MDPAGGGVPRGPSVDDGRRAARPATGWTPGAQLAQPLAMLCGEDFDESEEDQLVAQARALPLPRVAVQSLSLLALARPARRASLTSEANTHLDKIERSHWTHRLEVMSIEEARVALRGEAAEEASTDGREEEGSRVQRS